MSMVILFSTYMNNKLEIVMQHYISFFQFQSKFSTELRCYKFLFEQRWPDGFICPRCKHKHYSFHSTRKLYQCKACKYQASITAGTIFHKSRTSLRKWFWMIYLLSLKKPSYPIRYLQKLLEIKYYKTAWKMAHKIRDAMQEREDNTSLSVYLNWMIITLAQEMFPANETAAPEPKVHCLLLLETEKHKSCTKAKYKQSPNRLSWQCPILSDCLLEIWRGYWLSVIKSMELYGK
ncbi:MAG: hypothetical protein DWQ10_06660 [Calditrichaeota bacterium]|nr:MAG: hypothetical protein DWQ10_06660 [Calditrichota bacterium]